MSLLNAIKNGRVDNVIKMLENDDVDIYETDVWDYTLLMYACRDGQKKIVKLLLDMDNSFEHINKQGMFGATALIWSSMNGHKEIVELLLNRCDLRLRNKCVNHTNSSGNTALICASVFGHKEVVELLLTNDAFIDHQNDNGKTAIDLACAYYNDLDWVVRAEEIRKLLLNYKPENAKRAKGSP